ncbi:MAG: DUF5655 domain-containing protein [Phycisphaerales bacterium]
MASRSTSIEYAAHPAREMEEQFIASLKERTGRTLDEWSDLIRSDAPEGVREVAGWLKSEHGMGANYAKTVAQRAATGRSERDDPVGLVDALYSGKKSHLRPIHDELMRVALGLGDDVRACPGKSVVSLYREHVFANAKPTTQKRVDLGLALKRVKRRPTNRLIDTGGGAKGDRITHRIPLESVEEIDDDVRGWLKAAYDADE